MFGREGSLWKLKRAARSGDCEAAFEVGACYLNGIGVDKDVDKAVEFFKMGAENGSPGAALTLGDMLEQGFINKDNQRISDFDSAFRLFRIASEGGLAAGSYRMGLMYRDGKGVPQDMGKGLELITDAADKGFDQALVALFYMYRDGCGTDRDMQKAIEFLKKAAEKGNEEAISRLEELFPERYDGREK
ncbi:MAG: tetratricopeptide repeat protein [Candidatus Methanomethylophilaceae archaeon]